MRIYRKLSLLYMKKNKSRTVMMFAIVIATVAFMLSIDMIKISQAYNKVEAYKKAYGDYHVEHVDISKEKLEKVENDDRVGYRDNVQNLGFLINKENGTRVELKSFNGENDNSKNYFDRKGQILKGNKPKDNNEIVLDEESAKNLGVSENPIGKTISFELRKKYNLPNGEERLYSENKKFKVVGIVEREYKGLNSSLAGKVEQERGISYTYGDFRGKNIIPKEAITYDVILRFTGNELLAGKKIEYLMMDLKLGRMSVNPNGNYLSAMYSINDLRDLENINKNNLILILTVILLVFNMLNIIWGEYLREISMLRLIGARKRDIRLMVVYQSTLLAIIGTTVGIIVGLGITEIGINVFKDTTLELAQLKPKMHIDLDVISKTITISVLAIVLATIIPVIKIGRVGCIEAVTNSLKTKNKGKQSKVGNFIQNRLGIYRYMGVRNLWLKKTRTLVSILTISLCGYLIIYTFSNMQGEVDDKIRRIYYKYDMEFKPGISNDVEAFKISDDKIEKIKSIDGIKKTSASFNADTTFIEEKNNINKIFMDYYGIKESEKVEFESYLRFLDNEDIQEKVEPYMLDRKSVV